MIPSLNSPSYQSFDPYSIFENKSIRDELMKKVGQYASDIWTKPFSDIISGIDPVFSINDLAVKGLVVTWKKDTRRFNKTLIMTLVKRHCSDGGKLCNLGLYLLMMISSLKIGKTAFSWYKQLNNPIRGNVIVSMIKNIPKSIVEGTDYFGNIGQDVINEQRYAFVYFFNELNKTLLAYIYLTSYYLGTSPKSLLRSLVDSGYKGFDCSSPFTENLYELYFKYRIPERVPVLNRKTFDVLFRGFGTYRKELKNYYTLNSDVMERYFDYVIKHNRALLEGFDYHRDYFEKYYKEHLQNEKPRFSSIQTVKINHQTQNQLSDKSGSKQPSIAKNKWKPFSPQRFSELLTDWYGIHVCFESAAVISDGMKPIRNLRIIRLFNREYETKPINDQKTGACPGFPFPSRNDASLHRDPYGNTVIRAYCAHSSDCFMLYLLHNGDDTVSALCYRIDNDASAVVEVFKGLGIVSADRSLVRIMSKNGFPVKEIKTTDQRAQQQ